MLEQSTGIQRLAFEQRCELASLRDKVRRLEEANAYYKRCLSNILLLQQAVGANQVRTAVQMRDMMAAHERAIKRAERRA